MWDVWLVRYKRMTPENYISFSDFKDSVMGTNAKPKQVNQKSKAEILAEAQKIRNGKVVVG